MSLDEEGVNALKVTSEATLDEKQSESTIVSETPLPTKKGSIEETKRITEIKNESSPTDVSELPVHHETRETGSIDHDEPDNHIDLPSPSRLDLDSDEDEYKEKGSSNMDTPSTPKSNLKTPYPDEDTPVSSGIEEAMNLITLDTPTPKSPSSDQLAFMQAVAKNPFDSPFVKTIESDDNQYASKPDPEPFPDLSQMDSSEDIQNSPVRSVDILKDDEADFLTMPTLNKDSMTRERPMKPNPSGHPPPRDIKRDQKKNAFEEYKAKNNVMTKKDQPDLKSSDQKKIKDARDEITEAIRLNVEGSELLSKGRNDEAKYVYGVALRIAKRDLMEATKAIRAAESTKKKVSLGIGTFNSLQNPKIDFYQRMQRDNTIIEEEPTMSAHLQTVSSSNNDSDPAALRTKRVAIASAIADTLNNLGVVHEINDDYDDALRSCKEALRVYCEMCGRSVKQLNTSSKGEHGNEKQLQKLQGDPDVERTILNIALMERAKASYADRMALHSQAEERLRLIEDPYGNIHHNVASSGRLDPSQKRILLREALNIYADAYKLEKEWLGGSHPTTARTLQLIGNVRWRLIHDYGVKDIKKEDATRDLTQAAKSLELALGPVHPHVATCFLDLAALKDLMGHTDEALTLYKRALQAQKACLGPEHPDIATTLNNIGVIHYSKHEYDMALSAYDEASAIYASLHKVGEPPHPDASLVWNNVGELHKKAGNWDMASEAFEQSLRILKNSGVSDDAVVASTMLSAGEVYVKNQRYDKALITYQQAYAIQCNILGKSKLGLVTTLENIGDVREIKGQFHNALECFIVSLKIRRRELGDEHVNNGISLLKIGTLHGKMHRPQEAFIFLSEALRIFELNGLTRDHPSVKEARRKRKGAKLSIPGYHAARSARRNSGSVEERKRKHERGEVNALDSIAESMVQRGNWDGALETLQNALKLRREILGPTHIDVGINLANIASIHKRKDEFVEAGILYKEALRLYKMNGIESGHPHVERVMKELESFM